MLVLSVRLRCPAVRLSDLVGILADDALSGALSVVSNIRADRRPNRSAADVPTVH